VRGERRGHHPVPPIAEQPQIDKVGTAATKTASVALPTVLLLLIGVRFEWLHANWLLAAEHGLALGWVMMMIVGVAYHVLPRFSGRALRGLRYARMQLRAHIAAVLLIVLGLGLNFPRLFAFGALLMALSLALFAWTVWPTLHALRVRPPATIRLTFREPTR
jgi:hypothetical protein